jgi:hypothetical protein
LQAGVVELLKIFLRSDMRHPSVAGTGAIFTATMNRLVPNQEVFTDDFSNRYADMVDRWISR